MIGKGDVINSRQDVRLLPRKQEQSPSQVPLKQTQSRVSLWLHVHSFDVADNALWSAWSGGRGK